MAQDPFAGPPAGSVLRPRPWSGAPRGPQERLALAASVFDALSTEVAVVSATGDIIAVNDAWERFALDNGGANVGVGANYFDVCAASDDPVAHDVLAGLRQLLEGTRDAYHCDYPCHSPTEQRWMRLSAQRHPHTRQPVLILQHAATTDDRLEANRSLARANERLRAMTDRMGEGLCTLDHQGRITYVNPQGEQLLQAGGVRALGGSFVNRLIGTKADGSFRSDDELLIGAEFEGDLPHVATEDQLLRPDGSRLPIEYVATQLPAVSEGEPDGYVVVFRDVSDRKARELADRQRSEHATWMGRIQDALDHDRFVLYAQPIVDIATLETVQHELLIRMDDPEEGLVAPGRFLPTAEAFGMAPAIDRWVIARALEIAATGRAVELNLSARSLTDPSLPHVIAEELARTGAKPSLVVFEITETALIENDSAAIHFAQRLRVMGCRLALDDFGTGYSGFSYLKHLPVDVLKIDMEFVQDAVDNPISQHVISAVVSLSRAFGVRTIAEGVEDAATLELLGTLGVDEAQGYYLGRPAPWADVMTQVVTKP